MKRSRHSQARTDTPCCRAILAAFAILLNTVLPLNGALVAAAADPFSDGFVICSVTGGLMPAPSRNGAPKTPDHGKLHCQLCRVPVPAAAHILLPGSAWLPNRVPAPVRYGIVQRPGRSVHAEAPFEARAPPA